MSTGWGGEGSITWNRISDTQWQVRNAKRAGNFVGTITKQAGILTVRDHVYPAAAAITAGQSFDMFSFFRPFRVWYRKDGAGTQPNDKGRIIIQVDILGADANTDVASKTEAAILAATSDFTSNLSTATVTWTNAVIGFSPDDANTDVGGLTINLTTPGEGTYALSITPGPVDTTHSTLRAAKNEFRKFLRDKPL